MVGLNVFAAATDAEAQRLFTSLQQQFINLRRGTPSQLQPPIEHPDWLPHEVAGMEDMLAHAVVGSPGRVQEGIAAFLAQTGADELMVTAQIYDHAARLRSFEIVADGWGRV
jgi:alkanesulfonate monooxygenase SsuD/methylene tetrahydromethanopterin reductase-like flavin-dependent oxidoreductase (luciferase family)